MNFDYGNVLTRALQITWRHKSFWLFIMLPMLIASVMFIAFAAPVLFISETDELMGLVVAGWAAVAVLGAIASFIASTAGNTSLMLGILRVERGTGSTAFMDLVRDGFQYFGRTLAVILILQLSVGLALTIFFLIVFLLTVVTMGIASICMQPVMILLTPVSFLVVAIMDGALVAVIEENLGAWQAVNRAFQVVRHHVWKFVILTLIIYFGSTILSSIFIFPAIIPVMAAPIMIDTETIEPIILLFVGLFACLFVPLMTIVSGIIGTFMTAALGISYLRLARPVGSEIIFAANEPENATS
ncbi:MAG: hypothetical protein HXY38_04200 [Chloroflexi bacterium]|nr:hypothetical protein [Chloroflexota bacterium]